MHVLRLCLNHHTSMFICSNSAEACARLPTSMVLARGATSGLCIAAQRYVHHSCIAHPLCPHAQHKPYSPNTLCSNEAVWYHSCGAQGHGSPVWISPWLPAPSSCTSQCLPARWPSAAVSSSSRSGLIAPSGAPFTTSFP